nr:MAG TPA: hypothetical protein [Bacteriophage sp.]
MKSRCREIMNLADETCNQLKCYKGAVLDSVIKCLKAQREFVEIDTLLTDKEREDMRVYITSYIVEIYLNKYL